MAIRFQARCFCLLLSALGAFLLLSGCNIRVEDTLDDGGTSASGGTTGGQQGDEGVDPETLLTSAIEVLSGARRGPDVYRLAADRLNYYFRTRPPSERQKYAVPAAVVDELRQRLRPQLLARVTRSQFDAADGLYIGTQIILRRVVEKVAAGKQGIQVAEALFEWTIRSAPTLKADRERDSVAPLFYVLMAGHGTGTERAWLLHDMLMQMGIPACVLAVPVGEDDQAELVPWCVGVVVDSRMYLFDVWRLIPLHLPNGQLASLTDLANNPRLLEELQSVGDDYPPVSENLDQIVAWIGTSPECWSTRMRHLEARLAGAHKVRLTLDMPSLVEAVRTAGGAAIASVELWPAPNEAVLTLRTRTGQEMLMELLGPASLPPVQEARLYHLLGDYDTARQQYLDLREPPELKGKLPEQFERLRQVVREYATYAIAQLKADEGDWRIALNWFTRSYLQRYGKQATWAPGAYVAAGICLEHMGETKRAAQWYEQADAQAAVPELTYRLRWLRHRYHEPKAADASQTDSQPSPSAVAVPDGAGDK